MNPGYVKLSHVKVFKSIICAFQIWHFQLKLGLWGSGISSLCSLYLWPQFLEVAHLSSLAPGARWIPFPRITSQMQIPGQLDFTTISLSSQWVIHLTSNSPYLLHQPSLCQGKNANQSNRDDGGFYQLQLADHVGFKTGIGLSDVMSLSSSSPQWMDFSQSKAASQHEYFFITSSW